MRIQYELKNNIFKIVNEFAGISLFKKSIEHRKKIIPFGVFIALEIIFSVVIYLFMFSMKKRFEIEIPLEIVGYLVFLILISLVVLLITYIHFKTQPLVGTLIIDEYGILDENIHLRNGVAWDLIKYIIISKSAIYVVTSTQTTYVYNVEIEKNIEKALKKYEKDIKIIKEQ